MDSITGVCILRRCRRDLRPAHGLRRRRRRRRLHRGVRRAAQVAARGQQACAQSGGGARRSALRPRAVSRDAHRRRSSVPRARRVGHRDQRGAEDLREAARGQDRARRPPRGRSGHSARPSHARFSARCRSAIPRCGSSSRPSDSRARPTRYARRGRISPSRPGSAIDIAKLELAHFRTVRIIPVVRRDHPLAAGGGPVPRALLRAHAQIVLRDSAKGPDTPSLNVVEGGSAGA